MLIRAATVDDLPALLAVQRACVEAPQWTREQWRAPLEDAALYAVVVAEVEGDVAGFMVVRRVGGVAEIESVAVSPEHRRKGLARQLCEAAMQWTVPTEEVQLEVRASNAAAIALYRSLGFIEQGRRPGYYEHPKEDAVLMAVVLSKP